MEGRDKKRYTFSKYKSAKQLPRKQKSFGEIEFELDLDKLFLMQLIFWSWFSTTSFWEVIETIQTFVLFRLNLAYLINLISTNILNILILNDINFLL